MIDKKVDKTAHNCWTYDPNVNFVNAFLVGEDVYETWICYECDLFIRFRHKNKNYDEFKVNHKIRKLCGHEIYEIKNRKERSRCE